MLTRVSKLRDALARAKAQTPAAAAKSEAAEREFSRAHADALIDGGCIKPADLEALEQKSERAEREARVAAQAERDLRMRLEAAHRELGGTRSDLESARQRVIGAAFAVLLADARKAMEPIRARLVELRKASPTMFSNADSWALEAAVANLEQGSGAPAQPLAKEELAAAPTVQTVLSELSKLEEEVGQVVRDERAAAQERPAANGMQRASV